MSHFNNLACKHWEIVLALKLPIVLYLKNSEDFEINLLSTHFLSM